ncbi:hypothetical protein CERZMDRAFT_98842 [Cercospora zeae-maydis SCOH1-5]|uniref:DUF7605 domain-containing protein n=1 Tax=Cercospora zeae-maydis SCOH1-5 TaxID=717836 RepID=A0A6A6FCE0_9PEZI|nr:hypothetical protein CERZMDRAFT_98842 [Cercospora zeae-maydis SCOH1-5]
MAPFEHTSWHPGMLKRERSFDTAYSHASTGLFVTGQTPTPAPKRRTIAAPSTGRADSATEISDSDDLKADAEMSDDEDDVDESEQIYSQDQEEFPDAAAYSPRTEETVKCAQGLVGRLTQVLQPYVYCNKDVAFMSVKAREAIQKPTVKKQLIMLLGHTGSGKSSTTNSFVDDLDASKAAATGESCTCVPTLITATLDNQDQKYAAEICLLDEESRRAFLLEHVQNYISYEFERDETWSDEQEYDHRLRHETALKVLRALFCDQFEFESPGNIHSHISEYQDDHDGLLSDMESWCDELLQQEDLDESQPILRFDADTAKELNDALEPHIFENGTFEQPALWPLIEHVRKGIHGSRILEYTDFLDLPGTFDTNRVRAEFAHKFIRGSDALWTVTSIERPLSDAQIDRVLETYANRFGNNAAVICTRSDGNIDHSLARAMQEKKQSVGEYWNQSAQIKGLSKELTAVQTRIKAIKGRKRQSTITDAELAKLRGRAEELDAQLADLKNSQMSELVEVRNSHIATRLKKEKQKHLAHGAKLSVFCISNTHYGEHKGVPSGDSRLMSVQSTGIPALRKHALHMASSREFNGTEDYVNQILTLLKGTMLWAEAAPAQQNIDVMEIAQQPLALLDTFMEDFTESADEECDIRIIQPMVKNRSKYESAAVSYKDTVAGEWNASTVRAFFGQEGNHATRARARTSWNENFIVDSTATVEGAWYATILQLKKSVHDGVEKVIGAVEDIPAQLSGSAAGIPVDLQRLRGFVATCCNRIRIAHDTRMEEFDKKMSNLKMDTTRDVPSGYFAKAMRGMYKACKGLRGKGCTPLMLANLEHWLRGRPPQYGHFNSPFAAMTTSLQTELSEAIHDVAKQLHGDMGSVLREMARYLERSMQGKVRTFAEEKARADIRDALQTLKPEMEHIERELEAVREQYGIARQLAVVLRAQ